MAPSPPFLDLFQGILNSSLDLGVGLTWEGRLLVESGSQCRIVFKKAVSTLSPLRVKVARGMPKRDA